MRKLPLDITAGHHSENPRQNSLLYRVQRISEDVLHESLSGFRAGRSTTDVIFTLRQLQEEAVEQHRPLHIVFVDFSKAFETVDRSTLWKGLEIYGCPV